MYYLQCSLEQVLNLEPRNGQDMLNVAPQTVCASANGRLWKGDKGVPVGFRFSGSCDLPEVNNLVAITLSEAAHASQDKCTVQWHLFCVFTCRVHSVFLPVPHINTNYSTRVAKQAGPPHPCLAFIETLMIKLSSGHYLSVVICLSLRLVSPSLACFSVISLPGVLLIAEFGC